MDALAIVQPLPATIYQPVTFAGAGQANLLTPNPREAYIATDPGACAITLDLGAVVPIDTAFLGYTNVAADVQFLVDTWQNDAGGYPSGAAPALAPQRVAPHSYRRAPRRHLVAMAQVPVLARFVSFHVYTTTRLVAGIAAAGLSIRPEGHEPGDGRPVTDASRIERLFDGSYGVARGGVAGGWQWSMPTLTDEQAARLYALQLDVGLGGEVLAIEPGVDGLGGNEAIHWGKLAKLEPYARQRAEGVTRWDLQVQDWP